MIGQTASWPNPISSEQIGRTLGPEVTRQVPPVGHALDQLEKELHNIRDCCGLLEQRLSVVMRPIPVSEQTKSASQSIGGSPLTNQIECLIYLARSTGADVRAMLDCLEI